MKVWFDPIASISRRHRKLERSQREFLPAALEILETPESPIAGVFTFAVFGMLLAAVLTVYLGEVDVFVEARGVLQAVGMVDVLAPAGSGIVKRNFVEDGSWVEQGAALVELETFAVRGGSETFLVEAPVAGLVFGIAALSDDAVSFPGKHLLTLMPASGTFVADVFVTLGDVGGVAAGQAALLRVGRFPLSVDEGARWRVSHVGRQAVALTQTRGERPRTAGPSLEYDPRREPPELGIPVRIELDRSLEAWQEPGPLFFPGLAVSATIRVGRRRLSDWLLAPGSSWASH